MLPRLRDTFTVGHLASFADAAGTIQDGGSSAGFLLKANNLSDVASLTTSFNTISPMTTKGDLIGFDGTNNVRVAGGSAGMVLTSDTAQPANFTWKTLTADLPSTKGDL